MQGEKIIDLCVHGLANSDKIISGHFAIRVSLCKISISEEDHRQEGHYIFLFS